jgi:hypothetical protein
MEHSFDGGKYVVKFEDGKLSATRNGEPWQRDLAGDKLVLAMLTEVETLEQKLATAQARVFDLLLGEDGYATKTALRYLQTEAPGLYARLEN